MTPLKWFRFQASPKELIAYFASMVCIFCLSLIVAHSDDYDGDGYDDETGEYLYDPSYDSSYDSSYDGSSESFTDSEMSDGSGAASPDPYADDDGDGLYNQEEIDLGTDPDTRDSDGDGVEDGEEIYGYTIYRYVETETYSYSDYQYDESTGDYIEVPIFDTYGETIEDFVYTDPMNPDHDGDLLPDGYERDNGLNPDDSTDGDFDQDGDGLSRGEEHVAGSDYTNKHSDSDEYEDGIEVLVFGSDPTDANDPPPVSEEPEAQSTGSDSEGSADQPSVGENQPQKIRKTRTPANQGLNFRKGFPLCLQRYFWLMIAMVTV